MIGAEPPKLNHRAVSTGAVALAAHNLSIATDDPFGVTLSDIAFEVRAGEIVGIAGVSGNGQQELLAALSGEYAGAGRKHSPVWQRHRPAQPRVRRAGGLHFVPEERLGRGGANSFPSLPTPCCHVPVNWSAGHPSAGLAQATAALATDIIQNSMSRRAVRSQKPGTFPAATCRKFIVGREISAKPKVLIVSPQPTWGVDVGAAAQIRGELLELRDAGCAVLVVSEELDELFEVCDRMHVIAKGRLSPSVATSEATVEQIGEWMSGLWGGWRHERCPREPRRLQSYCTQIDTSHLRSPNHQTPRQAQGERAAGGHAARCWQAALPC